jgi:hypothetical protein
MAERDRFELDLAAAVRAYLENAPTQVRPSELARQFATAYPHRRTALGRWGFGPTPAMPWVMLLLACLLVVVVGGMLVVGSQPARRLPAVVPPVGQVATCPPGSTPDEPGPVGQARPAEERSATAFDRRAGRLVVVTNAGDGVETWTFDVCTNTWTQMHPNREPPGFEDNAQLVYDVDSDVTILVSAGIGGSPATPWSVWAYDLQADTWTERGAAPTTDARVFMAYDPVSGLLVGAKRYYPDPNRKELWTYEVETDTWTLIDQANAGPDYPVIAYDASVDRLVEYGEGAAYGGPAYETWLFDIRRGTWSRSAAERPGVVGWLTAPGIVYDEAAERTLIFKRDPLTAYDARADLWEILAAPETISPPTDPWHSAPSAYVYDAVNRRLVGWRVGGNLNQESGVAALDLTNRKWTVLLEPSGRSSSTPVPRPAPTSARTAAPSGGPEEPGPTAPVPTASPTSTPKPTPTP